MTKRRVKNVRIVADKPGFDGVVLEIQLDNGMTASSFVSNATLEQDKSQVAIANQIKKAMNLILEMPDYA